jgi:hypothetical protein
MDTPTTCDYIYHYDTQAEDVSLFRDYSLDQVFWSHISSTMQYKISTACVNKEIQSSRGKDKAMQM